MTTLTQQLKKIADDIVTVLKENGNKPMTQDQLFKKTHLEHMSEYGWSFALTDLERAKVIKDVGVIYNGEIQYQLI